MTSLYGNNLETLLRDLIRRVEKLEAGQRSGPGLTIGRSSGAFLLPATSPPDAPSGGVYIYSNLSERFSVSDVGGEGVVPRQGPAPDYPSSFTSPPSIGSPPTATQYNQLRDDAAMLQVCLRSVINSGRDGGTFPPA